jgi:hypothetical protein
MTAQSDAPQPRLLDIKAAARYLSTTVWQMRSLVWEKKVPHLRLGRRILFDIVDLDALVIEVKRVA